jgi:hypothetical protein
VLSEVADLARDVWIDFDDADHVRWCSTRDVSKHHATAGEGIIDTNCDELVPSRPIKPHQLTILKEPQTRIVTSHADERTAFGLCRVRRHEPNHGERWVVALVSHQAPTPTAT